jgi:hypothetical protein
MKTFFHSIAVLICVASLSPLLAAEGNGVLANVFKRTIGKSDIKAEYYSGKEQSINLAISVKNTSLRNMPEGELHWAMLVHKGYSKLTERVTGVETIKALKVSETVEITVGPAKVGEYHTGSASGYNYKEYKDKLDYEVIVMQGDQELLRIGSDASFAKSTKPITQTTRIAGVNGEQPKPKKEDVGDNFGNGDGEKSKPIVAGIKPVETKPLINKEEPAPVVKPSLPVVVNTPPPAAEYSAARPFDFFNLGGNGK